MQMGLVYPTLGVVPVKGLCGVHKEVIDAMEFLTYVPPEGGPTDWQLVALHGWGANAADLLGLAPYLRLSGFQMLFPEAPWPHPQVPVGRMWYGFPFGYDFRRDYDFEQQQDLQGSREQLITWLRGLEQTTHIPLEHTVLAGFSQGGAMVLDVGPQLPVAGQIILSGYLHSAPQSPITDRKLLMVHGSFDPVVPIAKARQAKASLQQLEQPLDFHEVAMGHEILPEVINLITTFCEDLRRTTMQPYPEPLG
jgi:phospholipase/carboxylesterase